MLATPFRSDLPCDIFHFKSLDSTNSKLKEWLPNKDTAIFADFQTAGRGQGDHLWLCPPGEGLLMSLLFYPQTPLKASNLLKLTALCLCQVLESFGLSPAIKAPNDILIDGKKIAGILIENTYQGNHLNYSIIGIGVNVLQSHFPATDQYSRKPVSLKQLGLLISKEELLEQILIHFYPLTQSEPNWIQNQYDHKLERILL